MKYFTNTKLIWITIIALAILLLPFTAIHAQSPEVSNPEDLVKIAKDSKDTSAGKDESDTSIYLEGIVVDILDQKEESPYEGAEKQLYQKLLIKITKGEDKGSTFEYENGGYALVEVVEYKIGDKVTINKQIDANNKIYYQVTGFQRITAIWILLGIFIILSLIIGGKMGLNSLIAMILTFFIIFNLLLPQIDNGSSPIWSAILASLVIIPLTFYLAHGINRKTTVAILATLIALVITGLLSQLFINITHLTGTADEEALLLQSLETHHFDLKGLLLAGIIIGTLGVLDDVTVAQSAVVFGLYDVNNKLSLGKLLKKSMSIGRDHITSMINTLILVYTGASMPLLLIFANKNIALKEIFNYELLVTEIVRTLIGSITLILAVPITTYLAAIIVKKGWLKFKKV